MKPATLAPDTFEIRTLHVASAPDRLDLALGLGVLVALVAPALSLALGTSPAWLPGLATVWRAAHLTAETGLNSGPFVGALMTQAILLISVVLLWRAVAAFAPRSGWLLPELRVDGHARGLVGTRSNLVLFYVADAERSVRVMASPDLAGQVPAAALEAARDALVAGMQVADPVSAFASVRVALRSALPRP
ncbi:MAG: hypothetical protein J0L52_12520 [Caulobacterales bacterium]|nr:hypothetical protein [Caulobacterales bacterium]